jgi:hypothetical protein
MKDRSAASPAELLAEVNALRNRTRTDRHAYWFPVLLFGVLAVFALPYYVTRWVGQVNPDGSYERECAHTGWDDRLQWFGGDDCLPTADRALYWIFVLVAGMGASVWWYRRHGRRVGVQTPLRGFLITGAAGMAFGVAMPTIGSMLDLAVDFAGLPVRWHNWVRVPFDALTDSGTGALLIIAACLLALARAERSRGLTLIAVVYGALTLLSTLYTVTNLVPALGWLPTPTNPSEQIEAWNLPSVLLPTLTLLVSGGAAFVAHRRTAARAARDRAAGRALPAAGDEVPA